MLVTERPGASEKNLTPGAFRQLLSRVQWAPILSFEDGYGFTYGARLGVTAGLGSRSRVSIPLTWGGTRQAGLLAQHSFARGPLDRLDAGVSISRRENPLYEVGDTRRTVRLGVDRALASMLRVSAGARVADVSFGALDDTLAGVQAGVVLDTRIDPSFPRNAVFASLLWERLTFGQHAPANRVSTDVRGYLGLLGSAVVAVRAQTSTADAQLPPYERALLGGTSSLRGRRLGTTGGDNLIAGSVELRVPLTSPLEAGRFGVKAFVDAGTTWNAGERLADRHVLVGAGGGVYLGVGMFMATLDAARSAGRTRLHFGLGMAF